LTPHNEQPEITTIPGEYDAPTHEDDYGSYFEKICNHLGERNPHNTFVAKVMANQEMLRRQILNITSNVDPSQSTTTAKRPTRKPTRLFHGKIKSDYSSWKREVELYFVYYSKEFSWETDKISWMERILKKKGPSLASSASTAVSGFERRG
jgi:hypothetical protein